MGPNTDKKSQPRIATTCTSYVFRTPSQKQNNVDILSFWECLLPSSLLINPGIYLPVHHHGTVFYGNFGFLVHLASPKALSHHFQHMRGVRWGSWLWQQKRLKKTYQTCIWKKNNQPATGWQHIIKSISNPFKMIDTKTDTCYYAIPPHFVSLHHATCRKK